ncbi:MBL fold metallo-hydrolase [Alsobacter sp. SYSU M60028]|uniref:MBL fold metallo-hydrolase n=1 Tax=Alsobacter ponti TaxID=2962936 RepID=A0ABT1LAR3_9HYPH|nr:MBL fold metallo-hydrolase [Alsobacter ponti]MCP8938158.1 MBL fold metallo-hydrolase [Alsobacter ponti]
MRLRFHGACRTVTGSCFMVETAKAKVLVDCGMVQGSKTEKELNYRAFPFRPADVDALVLTHAHIDHSGLVPKLVKDGFEGPIFATRATADLCGFMLPDSAAIQEMEVQQLNRRNMQHGKPPVEPIYGQEHVEATLRQFRPSAYLRWTRVAEGVRVRFWNAGHLLGSASVEMEAEDAPGAPPLRLLFSGDLGPDSKLLQTDPDGPAGVDHLVCESTYGDTVRPPVSDDERRAALAEVVRDAQRRRGALLIPSFAVERTQELLVDLVALMESDAVRPAQIFIDSPLASKATEAFAAHAGELEDGDRLIRALDYRMVRFTESVEHSKSLDRLRGFHVVIAASGMCDAGRIRHHLRARLGRAESTVLLVGFQAQGTLGRFLLEGAPRVRIMGEEIDVRASVRSLDLYSGHADAAELQRWVERRGPVAGRVFLTHGEEPAMEALAARLAGPLGAGRIVRPTLDQVFELTADAAAPVEGAAPVRLPPESLGRVDWHNDLSRLILDINDAVRREAGENARAKLLRRLRRALDNERG